MNSNETKDQAAAAVASAPRVTLADIEARIAKTEYLRTEGNTLTICVLTLQNGFTVTGESACADPANYNRELGERIARDKAIGNVWPLEGYLLRERLHAGAAAA